jgi:hypothetical protein
MRNLSKILIVCLLGFISMQSFAQKFGLQGGINLSNMLYKDDETTISDEFSSNLGFNAGVTFEMGFSDLISLEAALLAENRGFKWEMDYLGTTVKTTASLLYIDLPVLLKVGPKLGDVKVFGAAGPYIGYGVTGKFKAESGGESDSEDVSWGSDAENDDLKPFDFGAKFGIGAEWKGLCLGGYYSLGLANISPYTDGGTKIANKGISICVGYKFGK